MGHMRVLGVLLMAALALSATVTATAQAKKAEHGVLDLYIEAGEGHFGTEAGSVTFTGAHGTAEVIGPAAGTATMTLVGTGWPAGHAQCKSAGELEGTVQSNKLSLESGWISKATEAGIDFKAASGTYLFEAVCGSLEIKIKGSVIGHLTPLNVASLSKQLKLVPKVEPGKFRNSPEQFESGAPDVLESVFAGSLVGEFETLLQEENVYMLNFGNPSVCKIVHLFERCKPSASVEFSTINGKPEFGRCDKIMRGKYSDHNCTTAATSKGKYEFVPIPG